jgi:bla regulator protein BlaR1
MRVSFLLLLFFLFNSILIFSQKRSYVTVDSLHANFKKWNVNGTFLMYHQKSNTYYYSDSIQIQKKFSPLQTFEPILGLIALESGFLKDTSERILPLDSDKMNKKCAEPQSISSALKKNCNWFFRTLVHKIPNSVMTSWMSLLNYGNRDISDASADFWVNSSLQVSPQQQLDIFYKLYYYNLPFSFENTYFIRNNLTKTNLENGDLFTLTALGFDQGIEIAWYIGYVVLKEDTFLFVTSTQGSKKSKWEFLQNTTSLTHELLNKFGAIGLEDLQRLK